MNTQREFANQLSSVLMQIEDMKIEAKAIVDAAAEAGINTKALRKVAKELTMDAAKLAQRFDDEEQLEMFRSDVGLRQRKGMTFVEAAE